jgi:hypothetical protein
MFRNRFCDDPKRVRELRLRANPAYELVLFDRLPASEQLALEAIGRDPDGYGVLRPCEGTGLSVKSVTRDVALLWFTLQSPGLLPRYVIQSLGDECDQVIGRMVLDGVLAVDAGGELLYGPAASAFVSPKRNESGRASALAALSRRALEYAEALDIADPTVLSARLYAYNHLPATPAWRQLLSDQTAVERWLGIRDGTAARLLERDWARVAPGEEAQPWISWQSRRAPYGQDSAAVYKLYVSPACHALRATFEASAHVAATSAAFFLKVGSDVHGLLRPEKIVVYFREFADLQETAARLVERLKGCPAHGVPFTAEIAGAGLLSWGIDPAADHYSVPWLARESWRQRICNRLASALALAGASPAAEISATDFALDRLQMEGVDTETWAPTNGLSWRDALRK